MSYGYFMDLPRRSASDKVLRDKTLNIAKNPKPLKEVLLQWFTIFLIKKLQVMLLKVKFCQANN